jgi:phosphoribosylformimino-5-aminoimidazole carboxamide ribotide isomerase
MTNKTLFAPCVDLHSGKVKQIVGGTLTTTSSDLQTNFTSEHGAAYYAELYKKHNLRGGHVIMLGPGNDQAAREALAAWPGGLQVGGGIKDTNAKEWIDAGADKVGISFIISFTSQYALAKQWRTTCHSSQSTHPLFLPISLFSSHSNISSGS